MARYVIKRLLLVIPIVLAVTFLIFFIMELTPGNPATIILGPGATEEAIAALTEELGFDEPFFYRYLKYVYDIVVHQDMGDSYMWGKPVWNDIVSRLPVTIMISLNAMVVATLIGVPIGVISAVKQYSFLDQASTVISLFFSAVPAFWLAMMMIYLFSLVLGLLPSSGVTSWQSFIMPAFSLGIPYAAVVLRYTRSSMLETIRQDYVDTARAKGITEKKVIWKHALKNAILPVITVVGTTFGGLIGGAVVTETIYAMPGLGSFMVSSIKNKDIPVVCGCVVVLSTLYCLIILGVDLLHAFVDPRIKARYSQKR